VPQVVQSAGFLKTWWIDPINITVNSVENSTTWRWSGTGHCVTGILGGQILTWFTGSGWVLVSDSWQNTFNCSETTSASTVLYKNGIFCAFFSTFARYAPNKVNGLQNGTLVGTWNDTVFGSVCVNLLRFRMLLRRTQN
jgi:phage major head subunit gpT-like protein